MAICRKKRQDARTEMDRSWGYRLLCAVLASIQILLPTLAAALPTDGHVVAGQATIHQDSPTTLSITQASDKAILNWNSFSIGGNEAVHFLQPSVSSIALNRVIGVDPSVILGQLQANGQIFLINPNGILFGAGAQINVGGLLATTLQTRDEDFMTGRYLFAQDSLKGLKTVVNSGSIHVSDNGYVVLMAPGVSNEGVIVANLGTALLGSGQKFTLDLMGDGLIRYAIDDKVLGGVTGPDGKLLTSAVSNSGSIQADGGHVILQANAAGDIFSSVVNQSGIVRARSLTNQGGVVRLDGGNSGTVQVAGTIDVSGLSTGEQGGQISVLGQRVALLDQAKIDVSGDTGGGTALVGGNYQGKGTEQNAERTLVQSGVTIDADAISQGDGGKVIVWADGDTRYAGSISARGGAVGGNGGFVEVSGKQDLDFRGAVNVAAPQGVGGRVLLDPQDITLNTSAQLPPPNNANGTPDVAFADPPVAGTYTIQIVDVTGFSELFLQATTNITVANAVTMGAGNSIRLEANNNITLGNGDNIAVSGAGSINLRADADASGAGALTMNNARLTAQQGGIQLSGAGITGTGAIRANGAANQNGGNVTVASTGAASVGTITANGVTGGAGNPGRAGGSVSITGATGVTTGAITASGSNGNGANQAGGNAGTISITNTTSGNLTTGNLAASGGSAGTGTANGGTGGAITVSNGGSGNVTLGALTARTGNAIGTGISNAGSVSVTSTVNGGSVQINAINTTGGNNSTGGNVTLSSNGALQFVAGSTIQANGGAARTGTPGRAGGSVSLSGTTVNRNGSITASGSNGNGATQAGGNGGMVSITSNGAFTATGAITASGGNAGTGNAAGGNGGTITITNNSVTTGNVTTGTLTARTGNAVGKGAGGAAGSISVTQSNAAVGAFLRTGSINTVGRSNGNGGTVNLSSQGDIQFAAASTIQSTGGTALSGTTGRAAGNITIAGRTVTTTGAITANGSNGNGANQAGGNAGTISITANGALTTSSGAITARGGNAGTGNAAGGNGGAVSLDAGGGAPTITHRNITTTGGNRAGTGIAGTGGTISIADDALLPANTTLTATGGSAGLGTGGNVTFGGTVNGNAAGRTLTVNTNGTTTLSSEVGGTQALGSLTTNATGTMQIGGNVTTTGAQTYGDPVTLLGNAALTGTTPTFGSTVDGGGFNLALNFSGTTTINGANLTGINNFTSGNGGTTNLTGAFSTTGTQTYNDAVVLTGATTVTSSGNQAITFNNAVDGAKTLAVNTIGTTTFSGAVGGTTALASVTTNASGTTAINGGAITTTGAQTYNDAVTLGANTVLNAGAGAITFGNALNGAFSLAANSTGATTFGGAVGGTTALTSVTTDTGGTTAINGGAVTTSGNQTYSDNLTMNQATTLASTGGTVTFGGNVTNSLAGAALTVDAPTINLTGGTTIATTGNGPINFFTNILNPNGASINADTGAFALAPNTLTHTIEFGDVDTITRVTDVYYGSNFGSVTAGSFTIGRSTHSGDIFVTGVAAAPSALNLVNGVTGSVTFENASYVSGNTNLGVRSGSGGIGLGSNLTVGTGTLRLTTTGAITQTAGAVTAAIAGLSAGTGITLAQPANNLTTLAAQTTAGNLSFADTDGFSIGSVGATVDGFHPAITDFTATAGTITLQSGGAVTQTQRILAATLSLQGSGPYTLVDGTNDVTTLAANTTSTVQYTDANALDLAASTVYGNFDVTTNGALTDSGNVIVAGTTTLNAGAANDITLNNANDFSTVGITSGNTVVLNDMTALDLAAFTVSGALTVTTNGTLTDSGNVIVAGTTTLNVGAANDITLNNANDFSTVGITSGNNVSLTDANALVLNASNVSGNFTANATDLTIGGPVASTGGALNLTATNSVMQSANLSAAGANNVTVTATGGPITMAAASTTTSGTGTIAYTAGTDVTLGSLNTGGGVNAAANGGSVLSAPGSGTNATAGANSSLQAFNGVVGTPANPMTVNVNPGTLSIRATTAIAGISAFLTGIVLSSNALTLFNVPPGLVCFNGCPVTGPPVSGLANSTFGYLNPDTIIPAYYPQPSRSVLISDITSVYIPGALLQPSPVSLSSGSPAVQSMGPKAEAEVSCNQEAAVSSDVSCAVQ